MTAEHRRPYYRSKEAPEHDPAEETQEIPTRRFNNKKRSALSSPDKTPLKPQEIQNLAPSKVKVPDAVRDLITNWITWHTLRLVDGTPVVSSTKVRSVLLANKRAKNIFINAFKGREHDMSRLADNQKMAKGFRSKATYLEVADVHAMLQRAYAGGWLQDKELKQQLKTVEAEHAIAIARGLITDDEAEGEHELGEVVVDEIFEQLKELFAQHLPDQAEQVNKTRGMVTIKPAAEAKVSDMASKTSAVKKVVTATFDQHKSITWRKLELAMPLEDLGFVWYGDEQKGGVFISFANRSIFLYIQREEGEDEVTGAKVINHKVLVEMQVGIEQERVQRLRQQVSLRAMQEIVNYLQVRALPSAQGVTKYVLPRPGKEQRTRW